MSIGQEMVGASHQNAVSELKEAFETVRLICPQEFVNKLDADLEKMLDWRARIAVIGQVKAGKSTLLSALIGKPNFLPTEVNPWTSVVTNLHFGHPSDPQAGGIFKFFNEEAWDKVINGNHETREMAEDLLPGFKSEILAEQVQAMRIRARKRFGQFYEMLLGTEHKYEDVSRETLERYVCAGLERETTTPEDNQGRYSDITESAHIFFPPGVFAAPTILTDTPGVNDPFLVRDEFTCQSLSNSDIFVMTMSAHQALTDVDRGLLKMLAAHSGNQVIIFINRIDELDRLVGQTPKIIQDVRKRVSDIIPEHQLRIVAGSAHWAELALSETPDYERITYETNRSDLRIYQQSKEKFSDEDQRRILLQASGMPDLVNAMSMAIESGAGQAMRQEASHNLIASINACIAIMDGQKNLIQSKLAEPDDADSLQAVVSQSLDSRLQAISDVKNELEEAFTDAQLDVQAIVDESFNQIRQTLDLVVDQFIEKNRDILMELFEKRQPQNEIAMDMLDLQDQLEIAVLESFASSRSRLDSCLERLTFRTDMIAKPIVGDIGSEHLFANLPNDEITPVFLPTPRVLTLELTSQRGWKFWKATTLDKPEAFERLGKLIRAEIDGSVENLVSIGNMALIERGATAIGKSATLWTSSLDSLSAHAEKIESEKSNHDQNALEPSQKAEMEQRHQKSAAKLDEGIAALTAAKNRIAVLMGQLDRRASA